jgi:2',3'-cyclic-nucleotide 2'-phosphodiesterase (5'-nucleotidase family)
LIPILNALGLDAMTAHWEFAYGPATLKQRAAELCYPILAINVIVLISHLGFPQDMELL